MRLTIDDGKEYTKMPKAFQQEEVHFKDLVFKKKCEYIWDYYKWRIIVFILVIITAVTLIPDIIYNRKPTSLYIAMINSDWTNDDADKLLDFFAKKNNIDRDETKLQSDTSLIINHNEGATYSMESSQKVIALLSNKTIDIMTSDRDNFNNYCSNSVYYDLSEILDKSFINEHSDRLVYYEDKDGNSHPYGIIVNDLKCFEKAYPSEAILGIVVSTKNKDNTIKFIFNIFE